MDDIIDVTEGTRHVLVVTTSNPIPEGLQWKIGYKDVFGEPAAEQYYPIEAGGTEITFELTQSHWYAAVQRMSTSSIDPLEIVSVKRDVYLTDFTPTEEELAIKVASGAEIEGHAAPPNGLPAAKAKQTSAAEYQYQVDITKPYTFFALQFKNEGEASVGIRKIKREVLAIIPTGIEELAAEEGMAEVTKGLSIHRDIDTVVIHK